MWHAAAQNLMAQHLTKQSPVTPWPIAGMIYIVTSGPCSVVGGPSTIDTSHFQKRHVQYSPQCSPRSSYQRPGAVGECSCSRTLEPEPNATAPYPHSVCRPELDRWTSPKTESQYAPEGRPGKSESKAFLWAAVLTGSPGLLQGTASS